MSIQIIVNGENATEALTELSTLAAGLNGGQVIALPTKAVVAEKPKRTAAVKPEAEKQPDPVEASEDDAEPVDSDVTIPTIVDLRAAAQEVGKTAEGKTAIKALLLEYGSKSMSDVPDDQKVAFLAALQAL